MTWRKVSRLPEVAITRYKYKKRNGHSNKQTAVKSGQKEQMKRNISLYGKILDMVKWNLTIFYPNILSSYAIVGLGSAEVISM